MKFSALIAVAALALSGCAATSNQYNTPSADVAKPAAKVKAAKYRTTARGTFVGDSDHVTSGTAEVFRDATGWKIRLGPDFSLDGGPDPKVALGNGAYVPGTILGKLTSLNGEQIYALKPGLDIGDYNQIYIWCEQFNVPLGHANLTLL